jgi:hypothetical protein
LTCWGMRLFEHTVGRVANPGWLTPKRLRPRRRRIDWPLVGKTTWHRYSSTRADVIVYIETQPSATTNGHSLPLLPADYRSTSTNSSILCHYTCSLGVVREVSPYHLLVDILHSTVELNKGHAFYLRKVIGSKLPI